MSTARYYTDKAGNLTHLRLGEPERNRRKRTELEFRVRELDLLFSARCGPELPDDDEGVEYADLYVQTLAGTRITDPARAGDDWLQARCPWMTAEQRGRHVKAAIRTRRMYTADQMGAELRLTPMERTTLKIRTIGAIGIPKRERTRLRKAGDKAYQLEKRRKAGSKPRSESLSRLKPWAAEGISRRTWYSRRNLSPAYALVTIKAAA